MLRTNFRQSDEDQPGKDVKKLPKIENKMTTKLIPLWRWNEPIFSSLSLQSRAYLLYINWTFQFKNWFKPAPVLGSTEPIKIRPGLSRAFDLCTTSQFFGQGLWAQDQARSTSSFDQKLKNLHVAIIK